MLGLSRSVISSLIGAGFVSPSRGARNEFRFSFRDVVLLRTAYHLSAAKIPSRRMLRALKQLRSKLPDELPLSGLRISAIGNEVVVRDGTANWGAETGQLLMDFEVKRTEGAVRFLPRAQVRCDAEEPTDAAQWFARAVELESEDGDAAERAYRRALEMAPEYADAYLNLGALLCDAGRCDDAVTLYDLAIRYCPKEPLLYFNRAIALEDQHRIAEALDSYDRCLELAPDLADAHYNVARLHQQIGQLQMAVRHFSAYRRLQQ